MKKLLGIMAVVLTASVILAASGWAGRKVFYFSVTGAATQSDTSSGIKVSAVNLAYDTPASLTVYFYVTASGVKFLRYQADITDTTSVVYVPDGLWLKYGDSLTVSNSVSAGCTAVVDLSYD